MPYLQNCAEAEHVGTHNAKTHSSQGLGQTEGTDNFSHPFRDMLNPKPSPCTHKQKAQKKISGQKMLKAAFASAGKALHLCPHCRADASTYNWASISQLLSQGWHPLPNFLCQRSNFRRTQNDCPKWDRFDLPS